MTTSTNKNDVQELSDNKAVNGAWADGLTLIRLLLTPVIMFVIYKAWSPHGHAETYQSLNLQLVLLASVLFIIAALTDVLDDFVGGSAQASSRKFGWFDDIADSLLTNGALLALVWALGTARLLHWSLAIPVLLIIARDFIVALKKGYELSKFGFLETKLGDIKNTLIMLATGLLIASPWLAPLIDNIRAKSSDNLVEVFAGNSPYIWWTGLGILWIAAALSLYTGYQILAGKVLPPAANEE